MLELILHALYVLCVTGLAFYGFNALWLTLKARKKDPQLESDYLLTPSSLRPIINSLQIERNPPPVLFCQQCCFPVPESLSAPRMCVELPPVTIQLPVYNERHVIERLIDACAQLNYPPDKLQIQVLDDSTDQTRSVIQRSVEQWRQRGCNIEHIERMDRRGFKAGALAYALPRATGEYIAIFDADFTPSTDFLLRTLGAFELEEETNAEQISLKRDQPNKKAGKAPVGFVQARWGHHNVAYSSITQSQALALDGHFLIEQTARQAENYAFGFNGSAGIWRKACIQDPAVGGWQTDTLCEDLDLSYRAQLAGWRPVFLRNVVVQAEIPPQLAAFKRQQYRWACGTIQTLRKLGRQVLFSEWSLGKRIQGAIHLGSYLLHPFLLLLLLLSLPLMLLNINPAWPLTYLSLASLGPPVLYAVAQRELYPNDWLRRWSYIGVLTLLGFGLCLNNSIAVLQALRGQNGPFLRTPKFHVETASDRWQTSSYRLSLEPVFYGELFLLLYASFTVVTAIYQERFWSIPFLLLYVSGFGFMVGVELWQARQANLTLVPRRQTTAQEKQRAGA
ncbi:glycosyltransferase [Chloroflexi bacterium TSY]|nr:glycosyltransferase [Chloroflexi bacterium TSY]